MAKQVYLLDVNLLLALGDSDHSRHSLVLNWFVPGIEFAICTLTEAGFIRLAMNPAVVQVPWTVFEAVEFLERLAQLPGYHFWPLSSDWRTLMSPVLPNIQRHNQIPDAYLVGLAVQSDGILATTDKKFRALAGTRYKHHLLVLE